MRQIEIIDGCKLRKLLYTARLPVAALVAVQSHVLVLNQYTHAVCISVPIPAYVHINSNIMRNLRPKIRSDNFTDFYSYCNN